MHFFLNVFSLAQSIPPDALPQKHRIQFQKRLWIAMRNKARQELESMHRHFCEFLVIFW